MPPNPTYTQGQTFFNPQTGQAQGIVNFNPNTGQALAPGQQISLNPNTPIINTGTLNQNSNLPQLTAPQSTITPQAFVQGIQPMPVSPNLGFNPASGNALTTSTSQLGGLEGQRSTLMKRLADAQTQLLGKGNEQLRLEGQFGVNQKQNDLNALNEQIASKKAAFDQAAQDVTGAPIGIERQTGKIAQIQRNAAVQLGGLSALALAKQGSLDAAKAQVDRTLALEFDPIKQDIENTKDFINLNYQDLTRVEKRQADALRNQLDRESRAVGQLEAYKKAAFDKILKDGGTSAQTDALANAKSVADIIKIFGTDIASLATPALPNGKPDIVNELANTLKVANKDVPQAAKAVGVLSAVQKLANANAEGRFIGAAPIKFFPRALRGTEAKREFIKNRADLGGIESQVAIWVSGATLTESQQKLVQQLVPKKGDTDFEIRNKLNNLSDFMQQQTKAELAAKGVNYNPTKVDFFATPTDNYVDTVVTTVTDPYQAYLDSLNTNISNGALAVQ